MIEFIAAVYNEEKTIYDLINHVLPYVNKFNIVDDGSTDGTPEILDNMFIHGNINFDYKIIEHTGLPETVKAEAVKMCQNDSWIIMLDADERFAPGVLTKIKNFIGSPQSHDFTHIWFDMEEAIDGRPTRHFIKCRVFRKSAVSFSDSVHVSDSFLGNGYHDGWTVLHYKTSAKQYQREKEYLATYDRLVAEGKMTPERREELKGMHYFVR